MTLDGTANCPGDMIILHSAVMYHSVQSSRGFVGWGAGVYACAVVGHDHGADRDR